MGTLEMPRCVRVQAGPASGDVQPRYSRSLVVRRSSVPRCRLDSYRCLAAVRCVWVRHVMLWLWWVLYGSVVEVVVAVGCRCVRKMWMVGGLPSPETRPGLASGAGRTSAAWGGGGMVGRFAR